MVVIHMGSCGSPVREADDDGMDERVGSGLLHDDGVVPQGRRGRLPDRLSPTSQVRVVGGLRGTGVRDDGGRARADAAVVTVVTVAAPFIGDTADARPRDSQGRRAALRRGDV